MNIKFGHLGLGHIELGHYLKTPVLEWGISLTAMAMLVVLGTYAAQEKAWQNELSAAAAQAPVIIIQPPPIEARAAILYDPTNARILYAKNAEMPLPLASLTKLMSAEAVLSVKSLDSTVAITPESLTPEGDSGLRVGDVWTLNDLLTFGLIVSSNDALFAAAQSAGTTSIIERMNERAQTLGLTGMHFSNPTGLDVDVEAQEAGAYGSAKDVALLATDFLAQYPKLFAATVSPHISLRVDGQAIEPKPTATPILDIPGLLGAKTGYTDLAGGNLVAAFDAEVGHPVVVVVLGSTIEGRFSDVRALIEATRAAYR